MKQKYSRIRTSTLGIPRIYLHVPHILPLWDISR